jgi:hypothetical protein
MASAVVLAVPSPFTVPWQLLYCCVLLCSCCAGVHRTLPWHCQLQITQPAQCKV